MLNTNARRWLNLIVLTAMLLSAIPFNPKPARADAPTAPAADEAPAPAEASALPAAPAEHPLLGPAPAPAAEDALPAPVTANPAAPQQELGDTPDWTSHEADDVRDMALGDFDLDGDLDLATAASDAPVRVFVNDGGTLPVNATWTAPYTETAHAIAWADANGDGYLDLAVGNDGANRLYVYSPTLGSLVSAWTSAESEATRDLAWGDWDGDGDPDLAVANDGQVNRIYRNVAGTLNPAWNGGISDSAYAVAWGDYDGDADLDLVFGNGDGLQLYRNGGGTFTGNVSLSTDPVRSLAWADFNMDARFDLAVGTISDTLVYSATGSALDLYWQYASAATNVAWEDWDSDTQILRKISH